MRIFFKRYWFLIFLSLLATILAFIKLLLYFTPAPETIPKNVWNNISPGSTTKADLEKIIGKGTPWKQEGDFLIFLYPSENQNWPTEIYFSQKTKKVELIKEYFPEESKNYQNFVNLYGQPDKELYGPHQGAGFSVFVFFKKGVAIVANPESGLVLEIWYFSPTTSFEDFIAKFGQNLQQTPEIKF